MAPCPEIDPRPLRFEPHELFDTPPDDVVLSRYVSLAKYLSLLDRRALHFTRADKLGDPFEGSLPKGHFEALLGDLERGGDGGAALGGTHAERVASTRGLFGRVARRTRASAAASCWHEGSRESAALWSVYSGPDSGICIRSTISRVKMSLGHGPSEKSPLGCKIGRVRYIDYETDGIDRRNAFAPLICKRDSFSHEKEVRLVVFQFAAGAGANTPVEEGVPAEGMAFQVDVGLLIDHVLVAPDVPEWFLDVVQSMTCRLGFTFPVSRSAMARAPYF